MAVYTGTGEQNMAKYRVEFTATISTYRIVEADSEDEAESQVEELLPEDLDNAGMSDQIDIDDVYLNDEPGAATEADVDDA